MSRRSKRLKTMESQRSSVVEEPAGGSTDSRTEGHERGGNEEETRRRRGPKRLEPADELRKYFCPLFLDPNTAKTNLKLSNNNKTVTFVREEQEYPDHQDRFEHWAQLLCCTGLTGRCYWEVQWSGRVSISVSYRGIGRKGLDWDCGFGGNDQSWSLFCSRQVVFVSHKNIETCLPNIFSSSGTVGVYVDCDAGSVSFYSVHSERVKHIHTFNTTFTEPLLPGFGFNEFDSSVTLVE